MMRRNAYFAGLHKPVAQEAFSSWLGRGLRTKKPLPFLRAVACLKQLGVDDADGYFDPATVEELSKLLGLSDKCLKQTFYLPGDWLKAHPKERLNFCEFCLLDDFRYHRQPSSRITWFYWWFNVCPVHGCPLTATNNASAPSALHSIIHEKVAAEPFTQWTSHRPIEWRRNLGREPYKKLLLMALYYQDWYQASLRRGAFVIDKVEISVSISEMEIVMGDVLAIIGKKRNYPFDPPHYIAQLLGIKSWCSLRSDVRPEEGCEPFLCLTPEEHSAVIRMSIFALLGYLLRLPYCLKVWTPRGDPKQQIQQHWRRMYNDAARRPSYLEWLNQRASNWSVPAQAHFRYLLNG